MNISPYFSASLHKRLNEDMILRKLATKTQIAYIRGVNKLCDYCERRRSSRSTAVLILMFLTPVINMFVLSNEGKNLLQGKFKGRR